jgi:hypothetical protein
LLRSDDKSLEPHATTDNYYYYYYYYPEGAFYYVEADGSCPRQYFPQEEVMMQHSYGRYFP